MLYGRTVLVTAIEKSKISFHTRIDLKKLAYEERNRIAQHEAGHAVVTLALGIPLVGVDMTNTEGGSDHGDMFNLPEPDRRRRKAILCAAGRHAQIHWNPETNGVGCGPDNHDINSECALLEGYYKEKEGKDLYRDVIRDECYAAAKNLVAEHRSSIDLIAKKLLEHGALSGDEAANAIGWQNPKIATITAQPTKNP